MSVGKHYSPYEFFDGLKGLIPDLPRGVTAVNIKLRNGKLPQVALMIEPYQPEGETLPTVVQQFELIPKIKA